MQTDTWLTGTVYPENCPLCSQPLTGDSNTCSACGFTAHERAHLSEGRVRKVTQIPSYKHPNPLTPIPARASAQRLQRASEVSAHEDEETSPGSQARGWQHNSSTYEAASSLSSLSLILSETPTTPPRMVPLPASEAEDVAHIDEIDTVPAGSAHAALSSVSEAEDAVHIDEIVTVPEGPQRSTFAASSLSKDVADIDEIDTVPAAFSLTDESPNAVADLSEPQVVSGSLSLRLDEEDMPGTDLIVSPSTPSTLLCDISDIPTVPELPNMPVLSSEKEASSSALSPALLEQEAKSVNAASWSADPVTTTSAKQLVAQALSDGHRYPRNFHFTDRLRWWLLRPGHIEFSLWLVGSILLFAVTFFLLLATVLSLLLPPLRTSGNFPSPVIHSVPTVSSSPVATETPQVSHLTLTGKSSLLPGAELHLQGQGFEPHARVTFWLDGHWSLLDQHGKPAAAQSDAAGSFSINLWLGQGTNWPAGPHRIMVPASGSSRQTSIAIVILTVTPVPTAPSGGSNPPSAPVVPPAPTAAPPVQPTATQPPAQPTATAVVTPEPTVAPTVAPPTPVASPSSTSGDNGVDPSNLGGALGAGNQTSFTVRWPDFSSWTWLIVSGYLLSMLCLGIAGVLHLRRR